MLNLIFLNLVKVEITLEHNFYIWIGQKIKKYNYNFRMNSNFMLDTFNKGNHE